MSDPGALPIGLMQQNVARPIDPEQLEALGKKAAARFSSCGEALTKSAASVIKESGLRLAPEQIKRVVEFTNTAAFMEAFEKAGEVRNVTFEGGPANPGEVIRELNDGSTPAVHQVQSSDYEPPSENYKLASAGEAALLEAFGVTDFEKAASVVSNTDHLARYNGVEEVNDLRVRLEGAREHFMSKLSSSGVLLDDVRGDLCDTAGQEVLHGSSSLGDLARAWSSYTPSANLLKEAMVLVGNHLRSKGMTQPELGNLLVKTAQVGEIPNPEHPVVERFIAFTKVACEHSKLEEAVRIVDEQLEGVSAQLRGALS